MRSVESKVCGTKKCGSMRVVVALSMTLFTLRLAGRRRAETARLPLATKEP